MSHRLCLIALLFASTASGQASSTEVQELRKLVEAQQAVIKNLEQRLQAVEQREAAKAQVEPVVPAKAEEPKHPNELTAYWDKGLKLESEDGDFQVGLGGRLQVDGAWFNHESDFETIGGFFPEYGIGDEDDALEFRRARLMLSGKAYGYLAFRAEYEFAVDSPGNDSGAFREVWVGMEKLPYVGTVRLGNFKEPFSLEEITTDNGTVFMERALPNVFAPSYNLGLAFQNSYLNKRLSVGAGLFKTTDDWPSDNDSDEDQGFAVTGRITGLPWYKPDDRQLVHLGVSYTHRNPDGPVRLRSKPESRLANNYLNTGNFLVDDIDAYALEGAVVYGPLSLQGEYMQAAMDTYLAGDLDFTGYYVLGSWLMTGESRPYSTASGAFEQVVPARNFHPTEGGWGAWELALRYSTLDLDEGIIRGGNMTDYTIGLNWYLNPNARIMLNYVLADIDHDLYSGDFEALQTRFQINF